MDSSAPSWEGAWLLLPRKMIHASEPLRCREQRMLLVPASKRPSLTEPSAIELAGSVQQVGLGLLKALLLGCVHLPPFPCRPMAAVRSDTRRGEQRDPVESGVGQAAQNALASSDRSYRSNASRFGRCSFTSPCSVEPLSLQSPSSSPGAPCPICRGCP